ncbi:MAG: hypothetical protein PHQ50_01350 [Eubacteriales bacterium]|nr:hypothetical protein [Eubacteriales bacterium]MDD3349507.1 hypothetical protein [Eubacteriales bacterium]
MKRGRFDNFPTPSKLMDKAGVGKRDDFFDINTPTISAGADWY